LLFAFIFKQIFSKADKTLSEKIPSIILRSSDDSLAGFVAGFFDAEGYVSNNRVAFGINNCLLAKQFQFALLRLGIISSINEYDNRRNPYSNEIRYTLAIDDLESLIKFERKINFCSLEKRDKVRGLIENRSVRNKVRQLVVNGSEVAKIIRNSGLNTRDFHCGYFFCNKRQMSKEIFRAKILEKIKDGRLKFIPGKAPVFNLLTTTIFRHLYSKKNKDSRRCRIMSNYRQKLLDSSP